MRACTVRALCGPTVAGRWGYPNRTYDARTRLAIDTHCSILRRFAAIWLAKAEFGIIRAE
jgi:hypothetical protein